jgi:formylglycine-generating enzyme required for sulfatase activity/dienelactone hydrolase/predicted Ser/Thr protein kinase
METLSHYRILAEIDRGGMGIVYRAIDTRLNREVALKVLPPELGSDPERRRRLVQEAQAAAALKHPNIAVIYEVDESEGTTFVAMELIEGEKLGDLLDRGRLPRERALRIASEVASGLARAHDNGVLHRDLKPGNVVLDADGRAKIIDFGLAKLLAGTSAARSEEITSVQNETEPGRILGTVAYMSPEQARGETLDARSDVFSFGIFLHELLAGAAPFRAPSVPELLSAIIKEPHAKLPSGSMELQRIVDRCLAKAPSDRYPSMHDVVAALDRERVGRPAPRRAFALVAAIAFAGIVALLWIRERDAEFRWAREEGLLELERLAAADDYAAGFPLAARLSRALPEDPLVDELQSKVSRLVAVSTTPEGASVEFRSVSDPGSEWRSLGTSPVLSERVPAGPFWLKIEKRGFDAMESMFFGVGPYASPNEPNSVHIALEPSGTVPTGMVRVPGGSLRIDLWGFDRVRTVDTASYWLDKLEVTNADYMEFVDSGAYRDRALWRHEFREAGRVFDWSEAMERFRDPTGRPGPSTWEAGTYKEGQDRFPVAGLSWYEAAAFCESRGKTLPTIYHWSSAAGTFLADAIIPVSNFGESGLREVGAGFPGWNGLHDMAGNVKEWCSTEAEGLRYILGGAWNEPDYFFYEHDALSPLDRQDTYGFRCALYPDLTDESLALLQAPVPVPAPPSHLTPVSDEAFEAYKALFVFDPVPLEARVLEVDESNPLWRREKISFRSAYSGEAVVAYLYLPTSIAPPFQTIVYFPGASAQRQRSPEELQTRMIDFLVKSGRAVMYPIYEGTHERRIVELPPAGSRAEVDLVTHQMNDLRRSVDYLETRSDIQLQKLGYYGFSWGGALGSIALVVEPRFAAAVLLDGGIYAGIGRPEIQEQNYAPRVRIPILMVNGAFDSAFPLETSQRRLFEHLGTPREHKEHVLYPAGHPVFVRFRNQAIGNILYWFDRYLGPTN